MAGLHVLFILFLGIPFVKQRPIPIFCRLKDRRLPHRMSDLPPLLMLADGVSPGSKELVYGVILVVFAQVEQSALFPAGQLRAFQVIAITILWLMSVDGEEESPAIQTLAGRVAVVETVEQVKAIEIHCRFLTA